MNISNEQKIAILSAFEKRPSYPSELTFVPGYTHYDARDREVIREMCHELARQGWLVPATEHKERTMPPLALSNSGRALLDQLRKSVGGDVHPGIAPEPKEPGTSQGSGSG